MTMFLKVMHAGADEFMAQAGDPQVSYDLYSDVVSCHFRRYTANGPGVSPWGEAHLWVREPVKTAEVPGHCEIEKYVPLRGDAFLMNEQGRTVSKFVQDRRDRESASKPLVSAQSATKPDFNGVAQDEPSDAERTAIALKELPYWAAALIRKACRWSACDDILAILDRERIAVDA